MLTYLIADIPQTINYTLQYIPEQFDNIIYINGTLPNSLFKVVHGKNYNEQWLKSFKYKKVDDLNHLYDYLITVDGPEYIIIEHLSQIIESSNVGYNEMNYKLIEILVLLRDHTSFILDTNQNKFISFYVDAVQVLQQGKEIATV